MPVDTSIQIRKLPFRVLSKLDLYLEPPSNKNWEALIRAMPDERFSQHEVELLRLQGSRQGNTCTKLLLQDLGQRCVTVKELGFYLKRVGNYEAMMALDWPNEPVVIKTQPEGKVLSEGEEVRLRTEAEGFPPPGYQWYKNDEDIIGEVTCELRLSNVTTSASGEYYCIALNNNDSVKTNKVKVKVMRKGPTTEPAEPLPDAKPVITTHPLPGCILPGHYHQLHCKAIGKLPLAYLWYMNGQPLLNSNFPTLEIRSFLEQDEGSYACKVTNAYGDDISNVVDLTIDKKDRPRTVATDKVALLIGNQLYTENFPQGFQGQGNLRHTIEDTQTLGSLLHREDMGFNVLSFANLSRDEMEKAVYEYLHLLSEGCYAVFYFAGHGFEVNGKHYLVPVDAPTEWTPQDAVCIQWILEAIWKSRPKLTVILLDMCRVRPVNNGKAHFEDYVFPHDLKIVIGFATCSQSESYERVEEKNGIYMKHLKKHICRDVKIEDILHDVTTDVDKEARECIFTERQRPEYHSKGGGYFSLRDPVIPHGNSSAERWLKAHKLPERRIIEFEPGVKVELRFEHRNWLTNTINILVGVIDKGLADHYYAYIYQLPNSLEGHFPKKQIPLARSWPQQDQAPQHMPSTERSTEMFHLQRLCGNLTVTIALESGSPGGKTTKYKVEVFTAKEFGLAQVFQT